MDQKALGGFLGKLLVIIIVGYVLYQMFRGRTAAKEVPRSGASEAETFRDPVCGVYVAGEDAVVGNLEGAKLHFCSMDCLEKFRDKLENTEKNSIGGEK